MHRIGGDLAAERCNNFELLASKQLMSLKVKLAAGVLLLFAAGAFLMVRTPNGPALPNSPVALRPLIEGSTTIVFARVERVEIPKLPLNSLTNRFVEKINGFCPCGSSQLRLGTCGCGRR